MDIKTIEISCGTRKPSQANVDAEESEHSLRSSTDSHENELIKINVESPFSRESEDFEGIEDHSSTALMQANDDNNKDNTLQRNKATSISKRESVKESPNKAASDIQDMTTEPRKSDANEVSISQRVTLVEDLKPAASASMSFSNTEITKKEDTVIIENHFIDVGSLSFGAIFGLGEKFEDRVIMARTKVQCLMVPRFWLYEKEQNPGRIWQRRRFVVNTSIPSRKQLFENFLSTRKWEKFKKNFISSCLDATSLQNPTQYQDIPMMFHIINPVDE